MDPTAVAGMIFTLLLALFIGGFILLFPLTRRLGQLLEQRVSGGRPQSDALLREVADLRQTLEGMQADLARMSERQDFVDKLLAAPKRADIEKLSP